MVVDEGNESILQEAHRLTHGSRNADYGHPLDDYTRTAALVTALLAHKLTAPIEPHEMAMAMMCVKMSREINAPKRDNMVDAAGYAWVTHACLEEAARRAADAQHEQETFHPLGEEPPTTGTLDPSDPTGWTCRHGHRWSRSIVGTACGCDRPLLPPPEAWEWTGQPAPAIPD